VGARSRLSRAHGAPSVSSLPDCRAGRIGTRLSRMLKKPPLLLSRLGKPDVSARRPAREYWPCLQTRCRVLQGLNTANGCTEATSSCVWFTQLSCAARQRLSSTFMLSVQATAAGFARFGSGT
jgi:hypothetical protein